MRKLKFSFSHLKTNFLYEQLQERLDSMEQKWTNLNNIYEQEMKRLQIILISIRRREKNISEIDRTLEVYAQSSLHEGLQALSQSVLELYAKQKCIIRLRKQNFTYYNAVTFAVTEENYVQTLSEKFINNSENNRILCSSDILEEKNSTKWKILSDQLLKEYEQNPNLKLIYADFTYCSFKLPTITLLGSTKTDEMINILLLGESGVGKSTFINAFVNYLAFDTLEKAESEEPLVLIPVSFLLTVGENFEERTIYFGTSDNVNNEDFDHPGQSVTQHCKSYVFTLHHLAERKLRIIDTPGFGDTRGLKQDDLNMQQIFKYISHLKHLNAVCFLLKSNSTQLNNYFAVCLSQLLDFLGPNVRKNILFCFTNARSAFYSPGDTATLLKNIFQSFPIKDIPFKKANTFCFDNEAFRYFVALQNGIEFNDHEQKQQYGMSWLISLKESYHLVNYLTTELKTYALNDERQSVFDAHRRILPMVRPILETVKNNLRHIILRNMNISNRSIALVFKAIQHPMGRCYICPKQSAFEFCHFLIAMNDAHEISKHCRQCEHHPSQHCSIDYAIEYKPLERSSNSNENEMQDMNKQLLQISVQFAYFLIDIARLTKEDPFLPALTNLTIEEDELCQISPRDTYNSVLFERLRQLQDLYEDQMITNSQQINLREIYERIEKIRNFPDICAQLLAAEESERILLKDYEHIVAKDLVENIK